MAQRKEKGSARENDRRRTILRAAIEVFARKGYHGCRIADVAQEAEVAYGLVYHYFHNKEELLQSVFETGWGGFVSQVRAICEGEQGLEEKVRSIAQVSFNAYRDEPRAVKVLILEIARSPAGGEVNRASAFTDAIQMAAKMFAQAQELGELRADADPLLCASMLFGCIEMGLTSFVLGLPGSRDDEALAAAAHQLSDFFLHGVRSDGSSTGTVKKPKRRRAL
ncbi:MAG: TetR/AcrR family transcriptional regulator [Myxococcaceae bacterium]